MEKYQISPHLSCGEIWNYSTRGEISDFSTSVMHINLKFLHMANLFSTYLINIRYVTDRPTTGQPAPGKLNCRVLQFFNWIETGRDNLLDAPGGVIEWHTIGKTLDENEGWGPSDSLHCSDLRQLQRKPVTAGALRCTLRCTIPQTPKKITSHTPKRRSRSSWNGTKSQTMLPRTAPRTRGWLCACGFVWVFVSSMINRELLCSVVFFTLLRLFQV